MTARAVKLLAAENDLKLLMADVTRAMEKAQEAVARIAAKAVAEARGRVSAADQPLAVAEDLRPLEHAHRAAQAGRPERILLHERIDGGGAVGLDQP